MERARASSGATLELVPRLVLKYARMAVNPYQAPAAELSTQPMRHGTAPLLWNPDAVGNWSLLFTPLFGAVLVRKNWRALGQEQRASRALIWAFVTPPIVFAGLGFPLLLVWYFASNRPQARYVRERWGADYPRQPWGKVLGIAFCIWVALLLAFVFAVFWMVDPTAQPPHAV